MVINQLGIHLNSFLFLDLPEQVIALYGYVAQNADELSFEKGEQISIVSKDEKDWWKGELKSGEVGLFPANYVEALRGPEPAVCE